MNYGVIEYARVKPEVSKTGNTIFFRNIFVLIQIKLINNKVNN